MSRYPRDMHGYGATTPNPKWPHGARIAVQFVINYEEGGESCLLHGDAASEGFLSEFVSAVPWSGQRHWNMESIYDYGARAGFWRLHRLFTGAGIPVTVYGVATALMRSPAQVHAMQQAGWEIASHGLKWIEHKDMDIAAERAAIREAIQMHTIATGERPLGFYTGRASVNSVDLASEEGGFDYISDAYDDDLPYWRDHQGRAQLIIPHTLDANDMRFATAQGFNSGDQFFTYLKDGFDTHYREGKKGAPKMMTIGLHCRLIGRPGRIAALARFIDYVQSHKKVWISRRIDIARHWARHFPYKAPALVPSRLDRDSFVKTFGEVFEQSPWIAERTWTYELGPANDTAFGLYFAMRNHFRAASPEEKLGVLKAHPDLADRIAAAKHLSDASEAEQASTGFDALTDAERTRFSELNAAYAEKFGFPFIIAARDHTKLEILAAFERRIGQERDVEFAEACRDVERIAELKLADMLPA